MDSGKITKMEEYEAIDSLISCSENALEDRNEFERVVATSSWHEAATGWKRTEPNAVYLTSERKKKPKEKTSRSSPILSDSENYYQKVKKLAGMIANSNAQLNQTSEANGWQTNKFNNKSKNNLMKFQNVDVLSYDVPCWRYIIDPRTCNYLERKPLQILRNFCERNNRTALLEGGGAIGFQEVNGEMIFVDPALSFDRHLLEILDSKEEFRLIGETCSSHQFPPSTAHRTETIDHIRFVHPRFRSNSSSRIELLKSNANSGDSKKNRTSNASSPPDLKPLQKVTPTQRQTAEDSLLASKMLVARARGLKSESSSQFTSNKKTKASKTKWSAMKGSDSRVDWIPITKSTVHYPPNMVTAKIRSGRFQDSACDGRLKGSKAISFHRGNKGNKLTLSEAANLVSGVGVQEALGKLAKDLENKTDSSLGLGISISQHLLPAVSGTKFAVLSDAAET